MCLVGFERMYDLGMRKLFVVGAAPLGCCPGLRVRAPAKECDARANDLAARYNVAVASILDGMSARHPDFPYSMFDAATALLRYIRQPQTNGTHRSAKNLLADSLFLLPVITWHSYKGMV
jgi:hypothetical protein